MDYETGLFVAFLTWVWGMINVLITINSQMERNLNKIGQRLSWTTFAPTRMTPQEQYRPLWKSAAKFLLIAAIGLACVVLSWLTVLLFFGQIVYRKSKDAGAPQTVREFRWKLRNVDMSFDNVLKEVLKVSGKSLDEFDEFRANSIREMEDAGLTVARY